MQKLKIQLELTNAIFSCPNTTDNNTWELFIFPANMSNQYLFTIATAAMHMRVTKRNIDNSMRTHAPRNARLRIFIGKQFSVH